MRKALGQPGQGIPVLCWRLPSSLHPCAQIHLFLESLPFSTNSSLGSELGDGVLPELKWDPQPDPQLPPDEQQAQKSVERTS